MAMTMRPVSEGMEKGAGTRIPAPPLRSRARLRGLDYITFTGESRLLVSPTPRLPEELFPHAQREPSLLTTKEEPSEL